MTDTNNSDIEHIIQRLKQALEAQENGEGEISTIPTVAYCLECDEIAVDTFTPGGCLDHSVVSSDGYEHGGIQDAITALRYVHRETEP